MLFLTVGISCPATSVAAQESDPPPLPRGEPASPPIRPELLIEPAPSFSNLRLGLSRSETRPDPRAGIATGETFDLQLLLPFKSSPYGAPIAHEGLGSVRSAQLRFGIWKAPLIRPEEPAARRSYPVTGIDLHAAIGHRSFPRQPPGTDGRSHHMPFAFGAEVSHRPGDSASFLGRQRFALGLEYRRQYLPAEDTKAPVRLRSKLVRGSVDGAFGKLPIFSNGISYRLTAAYDLSRKVPGAELTLTTPIAIIEYPRLVAGLNVWVQGRDNDPRTRDKRFDFGPRLALQF